MINMTMNNYDYLNIERKEQALNSKQSLSLVHSYKIQNRRLECLTMQFERSE